MTIDIIAIVLAVYGFYLGYTKGIIKTVFGILSLFIGLLAALKLSPYLVNGLEKISNSNSPLLFLIGFALTFVLTLFLIRFLGNRFEDLLKAIKINFFNQVAGGIVLSFIFLILFSYGIWFSDQIKLIPSTTKQASYTYPALTTLPDKSKALFAYIKPVFGEFADKMKETMDRVKEE
jgi:membrane protein required for colicin V production